MCQMLKNLGFPYKFISNDSKNIICFLPSVRSKDIYPYYPRINWGSKYTQFDTLYLADPFQEMESYQAAGGSWFISPDGESRLPHISRVLSDFFEEKGYRNILFYGSSMGGYAGLVLGSMLPGSFVISECPQIYLDKHPGSKDVLAKHCQEHQLSELPNLLDLIKQARDVRFVVIVNGHDHHLATHVLPFQSEILRLNDFDFAALEFRTYLNGNYARGHTALSYDDAAKIIGEITRSFK